MALGGREVSPSLNERGPGVASDHCEIDELPRGPYGVTQDERKSGVAQRWAGFALLCGFFFCG